MNRKRRSLSFLSQLNHSFTRKKRDRALNSMKGYIKNKTIILIDSLPEDLQDRDEVEVAITPAPRQTLPFPTFNLSIKDEYLERDRIYEQDPNSA